MAVSDDLEALISRYRRAAREKPSLNVDQAVLAAATAHLQRGSHFWRYAAAASVILCAYFTAYDRMRPDPASSEISEVTWNRQSMEQAQFYLMTVNFSLVALPDNARQLLEVTERPDPYLPRS